MEVCDCLWVLKCSEVTVQLPLSPFPHSALCAEVHCAQPPNKELPLHCVRPDSDRNYTGFFYVGHWSLFIWSRNNNLWTHGFYFVAWVIIQILYSFVKIALVLATGRSFDYILDPRTNLPLWGLLLLLISSLSTSTGCSRIILWVFCPSPRIFHVQEDLWFFSLENSLRS